MAYKMPFMFGDRIKKARQDAKLSQQVVAELVGVSQPSFSEWERDISNPSVDSLVVLANVLGVSFEWLATGRGDMHYIPTAASQNVAKYIVSMPPDQQELLDLYRKLPHGRRLALLTFLKNFT